jgi:hypothetical protein
VDLGVEKRFGRVNVADAGDHGWVEQQHFDRRSRRTEGFL